MRGIHEVHSREENSIYKPDYISFSKPILFNEESNEDTTWVCFVFLRMMDCRFVFLAITFKICSCC